MVYMLRSVAYCHWHEYDLSKGQDPEIMDQGVHEIKLAIWESASLPNTAEEIATWLNAPALVLPHLPISQFAD